MEVRLTKPEELDRVRELFALAFRIPMKRDAEQEPDEALHWAAFDGDGQMMSAITVPTYQMWFDGQPVRLGGIGGVSTLPQYRRRGGIRACFEALLPELYRREYDFSYLYPFSTAFYRKFGYECCVQKQLVTVDLRLLRTSYFEGTYRLAEPGRDLSEDVWAVDQAWYRAYNMSVLHGRSDYRWVTGLDPAAGDKYLYVWYDNGAPSAYVRFQPEGDTLQCDRFRFTSARGFRALLGLLQTMSTDRSHARFYLPESKALRYLLPEWSLGAVRWQLLCGGMVRVVRVREVLEKAKCIGTGQVTLEITDHQIPENTGVYRVSFRDGRVTQAARTDAAPDAALTIPALSALISGVCSFTEAAQWMPGAELKTPNPALDQLFYKKEMFIEEDF